MDGVTPPRDGPTDTASNGSSPRHHVDVDPEVAELVPGFIDNRRVDVQNIRRYLEQRSFAEIQRLGHNMKGCGESYGFPRISEIGRELERAARAGDAETVAKLNDELEGFLRRISLP